MWDASIRGLGEGGGVWEGFDDEMRDEQEEEEINYENDDGVDQRFPTGGQVAPVGATGH